MRFKNVTYPVHHYESATIRDDVEVEVFGNGFLHLKQSREELSPGVRELSRFRTILIDPADIENLEIAIKEAKRRRNSHARRVRRRLEKERSVTSAG